MRRGGTAGEKGGKKEQWSGPPVGVRRVCLHVVCFSFDIYQRYFVKGL